MINKERAKFENEILSRLKEAFYKSWGADTAMGTWLEEVPELNQCAVTALVIQDYLGGDLLRCKLSDGDSHYWNKLPSGRELDMTAPQLLYSKLEKVGDVVVRERSYVLDPDKFPDTVRRYKTLKARVEKALERIF